jgi:hypothetical protein
LQPPIGLPKTSEIPYQFCEPHPGKISDVKGHFDPLSLEPLARYAKHFQARIKLVKRLDKIGSMEISGSLANDNHNLLEFFPHSVTASLPSFPAVC